MTKDSRRQFIERLNRALDREPKGSVDFDDLFPATSPEALDNILRTVRGRDRGARLRLLKRLQSAGAAINLPVIPLPDTAAAVEAIQKLVLEKKCEWGDTKILVAWRHPLIDDLQLEQTLGPMGVTVVVTRPVSSKADGNTERSELRSAASRACVGVTSADYCVAETATLVMMTRPGRSRSVSLLPSIHVAVIRLEQIVADLMELYALISSDLKGVTSGLTNCTTFVTGPSKTADIEATMVYGAHGPREVFIYVVP